MVHGDFLSIRGSVLQTEVFSFILFVIILKLWIWTSKKKFLLLLYFHYLYWILEFSSIIIYFLFLKLNIQFWYAKFYISILHLSDNAIFLNISPSPVLLWEIIVYSQSTINAYYLLSHEWWVPLIKFMVGPIIHVV